MQQWIPRTQTLEPKIWGQVGLRQGFYLGLGIFAAIFFLIALAPFGIGPRIVAALLSVAAGSTVGFIRIKGLSPERYLFHRLRFTLRRQGLGMLEVPKAPVTQLKDEHESLVTKQGTSRKPAFSRWKGIVPAGSAIQPVAVYSPGECTVQVGAFGLAFQLAAMGMMTIVVAYIVIGGID